MQTKFKRHQSIVLLNDPDPEYIEYYGEKEEPIKKGMKGRINIMLPNGQYHIEVLDKNGEVVAYVLLGEEEIGAADENFEGESAED